MKSEVRAIIFLQLLENKESFRFNSVSLQHIHAKYQDEYTIYSMDNFSDSLTTHYARKLLHESAETILICEVEHSGKLGSLQLLLNEAVKEKHKVGFFCNTETKMLLPFLKFLNAKFYKQITELTF